MRSVKGLFDGEKVQLLEETVNLRPGRVIVTFIEDDNKMVAMREYTADEDAFAFWKEDEDLYQDFLKAKA